MGSKLRGPVGTEVEEGPPFCHHRRKGGKNADPGKTSNLNPKDFEGIIH